MSNTLVGNQTPLVSSIIIFSMFLLLYLSFNSQSYDGDGIRWLGFYKKTTSLPMGPLRFILFPSLGWLWYRIGQCCGYSSIPYLQSMNAIFAALGLGIYFRFTYQILQSLTICILITVWLGFSSAYSYHATDMTEPMPSFVFVILSAILSLKSAKSGHLLWALLSAISLGIASLLYLSSILNLFGVLSLLLWPSFANQNKPKISCAILFVLTLGLTVGVAIILLYQNNIFESLRLAIAESNMYKMAVIDAEFKINHLPSTLLGMMGAILGLYNFYGIRQMLRFQDVASLYNFIISLVGSGLIIFVLLKSWKAGLLRRHRGLLPTLMIWAGALIVFLFYFNPYYLKLWIQPLAILFTIAGVWINSVGLSNRKLRRRVWLFTLAIVFLNLFIGIIPRHSISSPHLEQAEKVSQIIQSNDLIITEGYTEIANYLSAIYDKRVFSFFAQAGLNHFSQSKTLQLMNEQIDQTFKHGGKVYFIDLFEWSEEEYKQTLGWKRGLNIQVFKRYQMKSKPVSELTPLSKQHKRSIYLWEYNPMNF